MIRIAIPQWQGRISPVFDVAGSLLVVDVADGEEQSRMSVPVSGEDPRARLSLLGEQAVATLICGAISRQLEAAVRASGIDVIPQTCGEVEQVLRAYIEGRLNGSEFLMPGCCGRPMGARRRRFQARRRRGGRLQRRFEQGGEDYAQR